MSDSDIVRRGDVLRLLKGLSRDPARGSDVHGQGVTTGIELATYVLRDSLPADPVAAAAVALAEAFDRVTGSRNLEAKDMQAMKDALLAYREARRAAKGGNI